LLKPLIVCYRHFASQPGGPGEPLESPVHTALQAVEVVLAIFVLAGSAVWLATFFCAFFFRARRPKLPATPFAVLPPVTILKPVCGLEKNLRDNLRSACLQEYPDYQVVYSVQRSDDPAIALLLDLQREFGPERVTVAIENVKVGLNGKINNLAGALPHARHDILVISDSDVRLRPDYLRSIVPPLADPEIEGVSTFFKASDAGPWYEQMELLTINADHFAIAILADVIRVVDFCFGASFAVRKQTLARIGGLAVLGDYLVEDNEMGQRIVRAGGKLAVVPYVVDTMVDLTGPSHWWQKQTYWDQNTRAAIPVVFAATLVLRVMPLGLAFAALRGFDALGLAVFGVASGIRLLTAAAVIGVAQRDFKSLRALWLVPIKDMLSLFWFVRALVQRTVIWRGVEMALTRDGRLLPLQTERAA
jgi:ceramide glucosyltransferase